MGVFHKVVLFSTKTQGTPGNWKYYLSVTSLSLTGTAVFRWFFRFLTSAGICLIRDSLLKWYILPPGSCLRKRFLILEPPNPPLSEVCPLNLRPQLVQRPFFLVASHLSRQTQGVGNPLLIQTNTEAEGIFAVCKCAYKYSL